VACRQYIKLRRKFKLRAKNGLVNTVLGDDVVTLRDDRGGPYASPHKYATNAIKKCFIDQREESSFRYTFNINIIRIKNLFHEEYFFNQKFP